MQCITCGARKTLRDLVAAAQADSVLVCGDCLAARADLDIELAPSKGAPAACKVCHDPDGQAVKVRSRGTSTVLCRTCRPQLARDMYAARTRQDGTVTALSVARRRLNRRTG